MGARVAATQLLAQLLGHGDERAVGGEPDALTRSKGRWYCCAFSAAKSHWTTPMTGREVIHGTPTEENGAAKVLDHQVGRVAEQCVRQGGEVGERRYHPADRQTDVGVAHALGDPSASPGSDSRPP